MAVQCWPYGHDHRYGVGCDEEIPDDSFESMKRFGWGFVQARDDGSASGTGPFLACPAHRDDIGEDQRQVAIARCAAAKEDDRACNEAAFEAMNRALP